MRSMLLLLAVASTVSSTVVIQGPQLKPTKEGFRQWMAEGGFPVTGQESVPDWRLKIAKRIVKWGADLLKDADSIFSVYNWAARASGIDIAGARSDLEEANRQQNASGFIQAARSAAQKLSSKRTERKQQTNLKDEPDYHYFGFLPEKKGNALPNGVPVQWSNKCCRKNTATAAWNDDKSEIHITLKASECRVLHVGDYYMFATTHGIHLHTIHANQAETVIKWEVPNRTEAITYDIETKGVRLFAFDQDEAQVIDSVVETIELFLQPEAGKYPDYPSDKAMTRNVKFMRDYTKLQPFMTPRASRDPMDIDSSLIQTGDFFGVIRLDGLDPMLAWAMGSTTGHTTVALRDEKNDLFVCESTSNSSYWPTNGIQCTPWPTWYKQATAAGFNLVWAPLAPEYRARLNATKMWNFFHETEGLNYGYHNLLWGWVDTEQNNYPCLPPDYKRCLTWSDIEILAAVGHRLIPELSDMLFIQAWNLRLGTQGLLPEELYMHAETVLNMPSEKIPTIVEQDSWRYQTTRFGKPTVGRSMVCCVFVCNMWKVGGLFGNTPVNCAEQTNFDDYSLNIFNYKLTGRYRPDICKQTDPDNRLCQLVGPYTLNLNHFNESHIYPHMGEHCESWTPGVGPNYWPQGKVDGTC